LSLIDMLRLSSGAGASAAGVHPLSGALYAAKWEGGFRPSLTVRCATARFWACAF